MKFILIIPILYLKICSFIFIRKIIRIEMRSALDKVLGKNVYSKYHKYFYISIILENLLVFLLLIL